MNHNLEDLLTSFDLSLDQIEQVMNTIDAQGTTPELVAAVKHAQSVAQSIYDQHYVEQAPNWEVGDNLTLIIDQISNMVSDMQHKQPAQEDETWPDDIISDDQTNEQAFQAMHDYANKRISEGAKQITLEMKTFSAILAALSTQPAQEDVTPLIAFTKMVRDLPIKNENMPHAVWIDGVKHTGPIADWLCGDFIPKLKAAAEDTLNS